LEVPCDFFPTCDYGSLATRIEKEKNKQVLSTIVLMLDVITS
jgi:hypothetical protein